MDETPIWLSWPEFDPTELTINLITTQYLQDLFDTGVVVKFAIMARKTSGVSHSHNVFERTEFPVILKKDAQSVERTQWFKLHCFKQHTENGLEAGDYEASITTINSKGDYNDVFITLPFTLSEDQIEAIKRDNLEFEHLMFMEGVSNPPEETPSVEKAPEASEITQAAGDIEIQDGSPVPSTENSERSSNEVPSDTTEVKATEVQSEQKLRLEQEKLQEELDLAKQELESACNILAEKEKILLLAEQAEEENVALLKEESERREQSEALARKEEQRLLEAISFLEKARGEEQRLRDEIKAAALKANTELEARAKTLDDQLRSAEEQRRRTLAENEKQAKVIADQLRSIEEQKHRALDEKEKLQQELAEARALAAKPIPTVVPPTTARQTPQGGQEQPHQEPTPATAPLHGHQKPHGMLRWSWPLTLLTILLASFIISLFLWKIVPWDKLSSVSKTEDRAALMNQQEEINRLKTERDAALKGVAIPLSTIRPAPNTSLHTITTSNSNVSLSLPNNPEQRAVNASINIAGNTFGDNAFVENRINVNDNRQTIVHPNGWPEDWRPTLPAVTAGKELKCGTETFVLEPRDVQSISVPKGWYIEPAMDNMVDVDIKYGNDDKCFDYLIGKPNNRVKGSQMRIRPKSHKIGSVTIDVLVTPPGGCKCPGGHR